MWMLAATALLAVSAGAQVMQVQGGGALDANPGLGTSRQNAPLGPLDTRVSSQLYVDGQVTGLAGFHGITGYRPFDELHTNVPSASLRGFDARAMGLNQALSRSPYMTSRYYAPSATIPGGQAIVQGQVQPGRTVPSAPSASRTVYDRLYTEAVEAYQPLLPLEIRSRIRSDVPLAPLIGLLPEPPAATAANPRAYNWIAPPGVDVLSGMADPQASQQLAQQLFEMQARELRGGKPLDTKLAPALVGNALAGVSPRPPQNDEVTDPRTGQRSLGPRKDSEDRPAGMPPQGQDVFLDILVLMQQQKEQADDDARAKEPAPRKLTPEQERQADVGLLPVNMEDNVIRIHSLAGRGKDLFNDRKREGEAKLRAGRFYDAIEKFQDAIIINPDDPTGHVGLALGAFGAGELLRSAVIIRQAMERFPRMMELRYDVLKWLDLKSIEVALADLNQRLIEKDGKVNPSLAALGVWVHLNTNRASEAKRFATLLKEAAPKDALYVAFADYVLTGKGLEARPAPAATAPAKK
jgi:tetratricopeptide (TPR) repeat protein